MAVGAFRRAISGPSPEGDRACLHRGIPGHQDPGAFLSSECGHEFFSSSNKLDSGSGWSSFYEPAGEARVDEHSDRFHGIVRTEVTCSRCGGHLGHVFDDGPNLTGMQYRINSAAIELRPEPEGG